MESPDWLRYISTINATINPKNSGDRCSKYAFAVAQHEDINHLEWVPNIKAFLNRYNRAGIQYPTSMNISNYTLFKKNTEIVLIVLYINAEVTISQFKGEECVKIRIKLIKQSYVSKH